jgi:hypothetical protein
LSRARCNADVVSTRPSPLSIGRSRLRSCGATRWLRVEVRSPSVGLDYTSAANSAINDIDGDRKTDAVIVRSNRWWVRNSWNGAHHSAVLGNTTDVFLPAINMDFLGMKERLQFRPANPAQWLHMTFDGYGIATPQPDIWFGNATASALLLAGRRSA